MDGPAIGATAHWTANLGDVCRSIMLTADLDGDGALDVAASAENGAVAVISGRSGRVLTRCQVGDVVRALCPLVVNGQPQVAMASLDEAAYLLSAGDPARGVPPKVATRPAAITRPVPARRSFEAAPDPRVIILLYHDVLPEARYHYATSLANFRAQMDMLVREEYACVSLDEIADWIEGKGNLPERAVCITFDGPYQGQYLHALPILRERGFFGTLYITTDWIGTANHPDWHELRVMDAAGIMDVQNHTINHPYLSKQDRAGIRTQLERCDEAIERHLSRRISRHHAYPAGAHNEQVRKITRELGFRTATTVRPGPVGRHDDLMSLPRYMVCTHRTLEQFQAWLTGADAPSSANSQPASVR